MLRTSSRGDLHAARPEAYRGGVLGELRRVESGQAAVDYTLIVAGICVVCALALLFVSGGINGLFDDTGTRIQQQQAPLEPPVSSPPLTWPSSLADCENGGWQNYPQFDDQVECEQYVDDLTP